MTAQGCSLIVANGGKKVDDLFKPGTPRSRIDASLGEPIAVDHLPSPQCPPDDAGSTVAATDIATYEYQGWLYDPLAFQSLGMLVGLTYGLGEVVAFPAALQHAGELDKQTHIFQVWYSADQQYIWHTYQRVTDKPASATPPANVVDEE